jgi:hypothetical protein
MGRTRQGQFLFQRLLVELMLQDRLDAAIGTGAKMQRTAAGRFQTGFSHAFAQPHDAEHRAKTHFWMGTIVQDLLDQFATGRADFFRPVNQAGGRPLQIALVRLGPVFLDGRKLPGLKTPRVRGHAFALMKNFDRGLRQAHIQFGMDQCMRRAVIMFVDHHVIINVHGGFFPNGQFVALRGQRQENGSLVRFKPALAGTFQLLERLGVQSHDPRPQRDVESADLKELLISQGRQDLALGDEHACLHFRFVFRPPRLAGIITVP